MYPHTFQQSRVLQEIQRICAEVAAAAPGEAGSQPQTLSRADTLPVWSAGLFVSGMVLGMTLAGWL